MLEKAEKNGCTTPGRVSLATGVFGFAHITGTISRRWVGTTYPAVGRGSARSELGSDS
jgi:hypothetical protein